MKFKMDANDYFREGDCDKCHAKLQSFRGQGSDIYCDCGAIYNIFGQRLRSDLNTRPNPSDTDENVGDMEGMEQAWAR
jgi:hypothetical protein